MARSFNILLIITAVLLIDCSISEKPKSISADQVIIEAKSVKYSELDSILVDKSDDLCMCYPDNWNKGKSFDCKESYFVELKLNNELLALLSESETFSKEQLLSSDYSLYGKYHNRWKLFNGSGFEICETSKFGGFDILSLERKDSIDYLIIGPVPERAFKIVIEIHDSKNYKGVVPFSKID